MVIVVECLAFGVFLVVNLMTCFTFFGLTFTIVVITNFTFFVTYSFGYSFNYSFVGFALEGFTFKDLIFMGFMAFVRLSSC